MKKRIVIAVLLLCMALPVSAANMSDWVKAEFEKATQNKLVPTVLKDTDLTKEINRSEFAALSVKLYEVLSGTKIKVPAENPFTDTDDREVLKAYAAGITTGMGDGIFGAESLLTREQAATMLTRTYAKSTNTDVKVSENAPVFADDASISDWAKESVYFMAENGIVGGVGDHLFAPKANTTREQSVAISVRTFDKFYVKKAESLKGLLPPITFGTLTAEFVEEGNTTILLEDVTDAEYLAYEEQIMKAFPNINFRVTSGGPGLYYKGNNGFYSAETNFVSGQLSVTVKTIDSDY